MRIPAFMLSAVAASALFVVPAIAQSAGPTAGGSPGGNEAGAKAGSMSASGAHAGAMPKKHMKKKKSGEMTK